MKKLIERFALYLLRKIGKHPEPMALDIGTEFSLMGYVCMVRTWNMQRGGLFERSEVSITAIILDEEDMK